MSNTRRRVGVVGAGAMGAAHARTLATSVPGAEVVRVFDMDTERAKQVAHGVGAEAADSAEALVADVDAFVVASPDFTHADLAVAGIEAGKHVLCEKPLAVTADDARRVVDAEAAAELDTFRWLLDGEIVAIRVESPVVDGFRDPQVATLWTDGGQMATAEVFVNAAYGYDVRVEVVGTGGSASLEPRHPVLRRVSGQGGSAIGSDFVEHFADSYRIELAAWADASLRGEVVGASAWDGYVANVVAAAGVDALRSGQKRDVVVPERPSLYA